MTSFFPCDFRFFPFGPLWKATLVRTKSAFSSFFPAFVLRRFFYVFSFPFWLTALFPFLWRLFPLMRPCGIFVCPHTVHLLFGRCLTFFVENPLFALKALLSSSKA